LSGCLSRCLIARCRQVDIYPTVKAIPLYVESPHQWCRREACVWGRARVTITCMLKMQRQAKIALYVLC